MDIKLDLRNVTFVVPVRIDSKERKANLEALLKLFARDLNTHVIILEADKQLLFSTDQKDFKYHFVYDDDPVFHRTKYINQLFSLAQTPVVAVWDADAIVVPSQILDAVEQIRQQKAVMAFPYDGRFYYNNEVLSTIFRQKLQYNVFTENISLMHLLHGYYSCGGAFLVNKEKYLETGGENEKFYGWGPEDAERVRRMEVYNLPVYYAPGLLFHLWHPRRENSWFANREIEKKNRKAFLETCQRTSDYIGETIDGIYNEISTQTPNNKVYDKKLS